MKDLIDHFEQYLGAMDVGWSRDADGGEMPFSVLRFPKCSLPNTCAYATVGVSSQALRSPVSGKEIRQELILLVNCQFGDKNIPAVLQQTGLEALGKNRPYLRGEVIGPRGSLFPGTNMEAFYVAHPVYFPDSFGSFGDVVIAWLVPITGIEADFVGDKGWEEFEHRLLKVDPDLIDFSRKPLVPENGREGSQRRA
jgi:hypothetical protein